MKLPSTSAPAILSIGTALPPYKADQHAIGEWMAASFAHTPATARMLRMLFAHSGVETRYSCLNDYFMPPDESRYAPGVDLARSPSTAERMAVYEQAATPLGAAAGERAIAGLASKLATAPEAVTQQITHLVVASCTGFFAPGLDFTLAQRLQLPATVARTLIGFMGCSAMFNCLRTAHQIVESDQDALVLIVSVELCSIHSQPEPLRDQLVGASFFADGSSACLVGTADRVPGDCFILDSFHTSMKPDTENEMVWQIGNYGFALRLSPRIPEHLAESAPATLATLFPDQRPNFWAIHPGGAAIIDRLVKCFELDERDVAASRSVLRQFGNLSSATILFVLAEMRNQLQARPTAANMHPPPLDGVAMAFGPGLVIEMARIAYIFPITAFSATMTGDYHLTHRGNGPLPH